MRATTGLAALVLVLSASACDRSRPAGIGALEPSASPSPAAAEPSPTPAPAPAAARPRRGNGRPVTIAFGGDVHFEGASRGALSPGGLAAITPLLARADLAMVNLETAITDRGTAANKAYRFRAPAAAFRALRAAGVDVVSGANNHGMDFGRVGLDDTLAAARAARFPLVGLGRDDGEAYAPWRTTVHGQRIAFLGASQVLDSNLVDAWTAGPGKPGMASAYEVDRLLAAVRAARATSDTVVVYLHWGEERRPCPIDRQRVLARKLVDAGADVIVGGHAHVLLGAGRLDTAFVAYGLGNFVFYARPGTAGAQTGVLTLTVTGRDVDRYDWSPAVIAGGVPRPLAGGAAASAKRAWERLRGCTGLAA